LRVDAKGILSVTVVGANVPDCERLAATVAELISGRPDLEEGPEHICLDKDYNTPIGRDAAQEAVYLTHIRKIREDSTRVEQKKRHLARRWVAERAGAWLNGCRAILVRWASNSSNYLGLFTVTIFSAINRLPSGDHKPHFASTLEIPSLR
jgi:hypothetical protein